MRTLFKLLLNFIEVIFLGPLGIFERSRKPPPAPPPLDLTAQMLKAKQMDDDDRRLREAMVGVTGLHPTDLAGQMLKAKQMDEDDRKRRAPPPPDPR